MRYKFWTSFSTFRIYDFDTFQLNPCRNCHTCSQVPIRARSDFPHVARVGTTSDYDRQDYFQILCCGRDIVVTILKLKFQKQKVHDEFGSTESLVRFLISEL